ncbi:MAG: cell division protein FtsA [Alphaproteobacteria bacterium]|nr:cell division protein FtsA [Alphaproteobacteria bacterium]
MKIKHKPRGSLLAALDIGSHKNACFIGRVIDDEGAIEILGVGYQASQGIKNGAVIDINAADSAIRQTVHTAERMAAEAMKGYPLRDVIVNVPGLQTKSHNISINIQIAGQVVTDNDIRRALVRAQDQVMSNDRELIHTIPVNCRIDGNEGIKDPTGMTGNNMDVDIHLVTGELGPLQNMAACVERSHLDIDSLCSAAYASGLSCLVEDEMDLGCTVIDMGAGITSFAIFQAGAMIHSGAIPIGGWHVTNDIARGLTCANNDAERLKTLYGSAMVTGSDESEYIDVPQLGETDRHAPNHVPRSLLIGIIQPRLEEIFEMIRDRMEENGHGRGIGRRMVITGGASQLPGLRDLAQMILDKQVRLGRPIRLSGLPDAASGPAFSTAAGLLTYMASHSHEMPGEIMASVDSGSLWERFRFWWKENW